MEAPKRKVTAKLSAQGINGRDISQSSSPSLSPPPQVVVRAKISSTARARTSSNVHGSTNATGGASSTFSGALRPQIGATARRSPSPAKMRPASPSKLQPQLRPTTVRASLSKASTKLPPADRSRHGSISSVLSSSADAPGRTTSAPATPLPRRDTNRMPNGDYSPSVNVDPGSGSFRIKSKVSGLARPAPPSLSTILSPPSPPSSSVTPHFPPTNRAPRTRSTTVASRRPSASFSVHQSHSAQPVPPSVSHEQPQLVPLPTSPPASNVSFSSHSSASGSASSAHSHSTSTGLPSPFTSHARSESIPMSALNDRPPSPRPNRTLVARVRPGTRISGGRGRGRGWTSGSSVAGEPELASSSRSAELDDRSTDGRESSGDETRTRRLQSPPEDDPEDDVRAEAKSNRKIADLEITTRSLLTINAVLEASKLRQAREIRELRRRLRETRLAMPPGHFRLLTEQERGEDGHGDAEEEASGEDEEETGEGNEGDESFKRLKTLLDDLLVAGRAALAAPAPSSFLSPPHGLPSPSTASGSRSNLGLGVDTFVTGTRMDQGEVLGWDVGSGLGAEASSNVGAETGARRWKHGVAIGSKVLSPEEAKLWVGEEGDKEAEGRRRVEADTTEGRRESDCEGSPAAHEDAADSYGDTESDIEALT